MRQKSAKAESSECCLVCEGNGWRIVKGTRPPKRKKAASGESLFSVVGEKIPYEFLPKVRESVREICGTPVNGIYLAHDSMGVVRYAGRGGVFGRLRSHEQKHPSELKYFSFYVIRDKFHESEIETLCIRVAGPQLAFNTQKKREDLRAGSVRDWHPGTIFYQRRYARGMRPKKK